MKETIRETIRALGADVCGFANIARFAAAPEGYRPTDIYASCRSVVVIGIALPKGLLQVSPRLVYGHFNRELSHTVDAVTLRAARAIEQLMGGMALPLPCDNPYEYWDVERKEGRGLLSMKHAAVLAGLGSIGKNALLLNATFGSRLCVSAVLTDLVLEPDTLSAELCVAGCRKCLDNCPATAIRDGHVDQLLCRSHTYGKTARGFDTVDCNRCRTVCPIRWGR